MGRKSTKQVASAGPAAPEQREESVEAIKGFDQNFQCRGFQFDLGKTYECEGDIVACENGFHGIEGHPLEVFQYYPPGRSRYGITKHSGQIARHLEDSKIASTKITIEGELKLPDLIARAIKYVFDRVKPEAAAGEPHGAATASGDHGAATASGDYGAATASGDCGAATASGNSGAATASGYYGKVLGAKGCALFLVYRDPDDGSIKHAWAGIAGKDGIKQDTFYRLNDKGRPEEVAA